MKKILFILLFLAVSNTSYANGKILKSGFITKSASVEEGMNIDDPKNKIIIIYNHGQNTNDRAKKSECIWVNQIRNQASLIDEEINGKKIMVYNFCSNDFAGDMSVKKSWWKSKTPYEGNHKLDKRVEKNLELVEKFTNLGNDWDTTDVTCVRDYIHIHDLAESHVRALEYISIKRWYN